MWIYLGISKSKMWICGRSIVFIHLPTFLEKFCTRSPQRMEEKWEEKEKRKKGKKETFFRGLYEEHANGFPVVLPPPLFVRHSQASIPLS